MVDSSTFLFIDRIKIIYIYIYIYIYSFCEISSAARLMYIYIYIYIYKTNSGLYLAETMINANNTVDLALITSTPAQAETHFRSLEQSVLVSW